MKLPIRRMSLTAVSALVIGACSQPTRVMIREDPPPGASSPTGTVRRFEWAVNHASIELLEELFTEDFEYVGASIDSAGNPTREVVGGRAWLLEAFRCLFEGGGVEGGPRASLSFDGNLVPFPDPRPGHVDSLFKMIRTSVDFQLDLGDTSKLETTGYALFYLVRGDTAAIPQDLRNRGFKPDRSRWWIARWEDETIALENSARYGTSPSKRLALGELLGLFGCAP